MLCYKSVFILYFIAFFMVQCKKEQPPGPDPETSPPTPEITAGPSGTVNNAYVTFKWRVEDELGVVFQYKLTPGQNDWSDWTTETNKTFILDEGSYSFEVRASYNFEPKKPGSTKLQNFTVDAVQGPAIMFTPRLREVAEGEVFQVNIFAEEVTDIFAVRAFIRFNPDELEVTGKVEKGSFLTENNGQVVMLDTINVTEGTIDINIGVATGNPSGVSGSGVLATIPFRLKAISQTDTTKIQFDDTVYRTPINENISPVTKIEGLVVIKQ